MLSIHRISFYVFILSVLYTNMTLPIYAQEEKKYPIDKLSEDIEYLVEAIKEIHPDPFVYTSKESFEERVSRIKSSLYSGMNGAEFLKLIMPLVSSLGDGHTELDIPEEEKLGFYVKHPELMFPWDVLIRNGNVNILSEHSNPLIAINGYDVDSLLTVMRSYTSAERESYREIIIQKRFKRLLRLIIGEQTTYTLSFKEDDEPKTFDSNIISALNASVEREEKVKKYFFELDEELNSGVLTFNSMEKLDDFKMVLENAFKQMKESNTQKLIIDIRNNGGGNSELGDALLDYIVPVPFKQVDKMLIKASAKQKKYIRENYIKWYIYPFVFFNKIGRATFAKDGKITEYVFDSQKPKYSFEGEVLVLTSRFTFSSATILANAIKCYEAGLVLGEETGGNTVFFGDNIEIELPNTKIKGTVSFKKFYLPCGKEDLSGVKPDLEILGINDMSLEEIDAILDNH